MNLGTLKSQEVSKMEKTRDFQFPVQQRDFGSHRSHPQNNKKGNQTDSQKLILFSSKNSGHKANCQPENWRDG